MTELLTLQEAQKKFPKKHFRERCHAIELLDRDKSIDYVSDLLNIRQEAVYQWAKRWHTMGIVGLMILPSRGLKAPLSDLLAESTTNSIDLIKKKIAANPQKLEEVADELSVAFKFSISYGQLKRFIKEKLHYSWRRLRKWLKPKQDPIEYSHLFQLLQKLRESEESGFLDLFYGD